MTTYEEYAAAASRTPCGLLVMTLDTCANVFGIAPCTANGEPCYNTWCTCKDQAHYLRTTRDYEFTTFAASPLPLVGPRPYLKNVTFYAAEIKVDGKGSKGTLTGRVTFDLYDEPDGDVGIDPYLSSRAAPFKASYWKRLLARNPNYIKRTVRYFEGFVGLDRSLWQQRWLGDIEEITLGNGVVQIKSVDQLKRLDNINIPAKVDIQTVNDVTAIQDEIVLTSLLGLTTPAGHIRIEDEVISYSGVDATQNKLTGCTRGVGRTLAAAYYADTKVSLVLRLTGNPFDLLQNFLTDDAGIAAGDIDAAAFNAWKTFPVQEPDFSAWLSESMKLADLFWELVDLLDAQIWFSEDQKITCGRTVPNLPGRSYTTLTDAENIVKGSLKVDLNAASRQSEIIVNWHKTAVGRDDETSSYGRVSVAIDGPSVGANGNGLIPRTLYCRWIDLDALQEEVAVAYIESLGYRRLWRWADPQPLIDCEVELKDGGLMTGDYVRLSTAAIVEPSGADVERVVAQAVKRGHGRGHNLALRLWRLPTTRLAIIAPDGTSDYAVASEAEREYGFITADDGRMSADLTNGYHAW